uniref:Ovule protein n=1 Tax=Steinernema glaseri TaxID=37863 RepID=A0A1I7ZAY1_9BILA
MGHNPQLRQYWQSSSPPDSLWWALVNTNPRNVAFSPYLLFSKDFGPKTSGNFLISPHVPKTFKSRRKQDRPKQSDCVIHRERTVAPVSLIRLV